MKYLSQYRTLHAAGKFPGVSIMPFVGDIAELVGEYQSKTILDFGCGKGLQYSRDKIFKAWGNHPPTLYDPAVEAFAVKPVGQFDGVISTGMLEHVPIDELDAVVTDIAAYAKQWVFLSVCCRPAKSLRFPDGQNIHVTIKPFPWWLDFLNPYFSGVHLEVRETK